MNGSKMMFDGSHLMNRSKWFMSIDLPVHAMCVCFFKGEKCYWALNGYQLCICGGEVAIVLQINLSNCLGLLQLVQT